MLWCQGFQVEGSINIACCVDWSIVNYYSQTVAPMCLLDSPDITACDQAFLLCVCICIYWRCQGLGNESVHCMCVNCVWTMQRSISECIPSPLIYIYWLLICLLDSTWHSHANPYILLVCIAYTTSSDILMPTRTFFLCALPTQPAATFSCQPVHSSCVYCLHNQQQHSHANLYILLVCIAYTTSSLMTHKLILLQ